MSPFTGGQMFQGPMVPFAGSQMVPADPISQMVQANPMMGMLQTMMVQAVQAGVAPLREDIASMKKEQHQSAQTLRRVEQKLAALSAFTSDHQRLEELKSVVEKDDAYRARQEARKAAKRNAMKDE